MRVEEVGHLMNSNRLGVRASLGPRWRRVARATADALLGRAVGSIGGARRPTRQVAVTFDDGPDPDVTPLLLDELRRHDTRCTFFLLVPQAERHPELVRAIVQDGHEIALHGLDHRPLPSLTHRDATRTLTEARARLERVAGLPVRFYRPPYGSQSLGSWAAVRRAGLEVVVWSADAADWEDRSARDVAATGTRRLQPGGILLLHERLEPGPDGSPVVTSFDRIEMTRLVLDGVAAAGGAAVTVGELVAPGARRTAWFR
jgi:peptidoglycan/xylan/chitin deacetylase (PgdA/CDA1 family)